MVTPQIESPEIAAKLGLEKLYFKREDLHPLGSHKGRSIPIMIDMKIAQGAKNFAISSSGNAALAAIRHIKKRNSDGDNITLSVLVGENINEDKLKTLEEEVQDQENQENKEQDKKDQRIKLEKTARPLQALFHIAGIGSQTSLRQSTDPEALIGYKNLALEIMATPNLSAVFIGTSSGTTAQALAENFIEQGKLIAIHIVQTTSMSPLTHALNNPLGIKEMKIEPSLADAIVDKAAHRKSALTQAIKKTNGTGWIATNELILSAQRMLKELTSIDVTANGALALAGLIHAIQRGTKFSGAVICIITGK